METHFSGLQGAAVSREILAKDAVHAGADKADATASSLALAGKIVLAVLAIVVAAVVLAPYEARVENAAPPAERVSN
jgi:hypothetical protein